MFKDFFEKYQKRYAELLGGLLKEIQKDFDAMWKKTLEELETVKITKQQELSKLEADCQIKSGELVEINESIPALKDEKNKLTKEIEKIKQEQKEALDQILLMDEKSRQLEKREQELDKREKMIKAEERKVTIEKSLLRDKQMSLKRVWENINK